jgi:hypothetical protein
MISSVVTAIRRLPLHLPLALLAGVNKFDIPAILSARLIVKFKEKILYGT